MNERNQIIIAIIVSIIGIISLIIIMSFIIWFICCRKLNSINYKRKEKKKNFDTNDSTLSLSFNSPHLK